VDVADDPDVSQFKGTEIAQPDRPELTSARIIISGGRSARPRTSRPIWGQRKKISQ
jgi:electron transfer flavoprotein alpha subunit